MIKLTIHPSKISLIFLNYYDTFKHICFDIDIRISNYCAKFQSADAGISPHVLFIKINEYILVNIRIQT